jgi:hypothetical protein
MVFSDRKAFCCLDPQDAKDYMEILDHMVFCFWVLLVLQDYKGTEDRKEHDYQVTLASSDRKDFWALWVSDWWDRLGVKDRSLLDWQVCRFSDRRVSCCWATQAWKDRTGCLGRRVFCCRRTQARSDRKGSSDRKAFCCEGLLGASGSKGLLGCTASCSRVLLASSGRKGSSLRGCTAFCCSRTQGTRDCTELLGRRVFGWWGLRRESGRTPWSGHKGLCCPRPRVSSDRKGSRGGSWASCSSLKRAAQGRIRPWGC